MPPNKCNLLLNRILTAIIITDGTKEDEIKFSNVEESNVEGVMDAIFTKEILYTDKNGDDIGDMKSK